MTAAYILPNVGATGTVTLKAPFAGLCAANVPFKVSGVRTLQDVVAGGQDPFNLYYLPYGITEAKFIQDVADKVCILSLTSPTGEPVHVPNSYLETLPVSTGMPYATMFVGVNLGAMPSGLSLAYFMATVKQLAHDLLGVSNADVKAMKASSTTYLSMTDAEAIEAARQTVMGVVVTDRAKLIAALDVTVALQSRNADLEAYILNPPPH